MTIDSSTIIWAASVTIGGISALFGALAYFIRYLFEKMMSRLDLLSDQRTECRETLSTRFADKVETQYNIGRLVDKTESLDNRVSLIEGSIRRQ